MLPNRSTASSPSDRVPRPPKRRLEAPSNCGGEKPSPLSKDASPESSPLSPVSPATEQFIRQRLRDKMRSSALRDLLQKGLSLMDQGDKLSSDAATFAGGPLSLTHDACGSTMASSSFFSEASTASVDPKQAPMDIYHPDFWSACSLETSSEDTNSSCHQSATTATASLPSADGGRNRSVLVGGIKATAAVEIDDCSVVSDVTILSDALSSCRLANERGDPTNDWQTTYRSAGTSSDSVSPSILTVSQSSFPGRERKKKRRHTNAVRFSDVNVREYERIMSDNPACRSGPGIGIGWNYDATETNLSVDEWEDRRARARCSSIVALSRSKREEMIRELGYSERDIAAMCRELNRQRSYRRQTVNNLGLEQLEIAIENAKRTCRNMLLSSIRKG
jgi:hypothetical protein